jgi:glycine oxidase
MTSPEPADLVVIGAGVLGLAGAARAALAGRRVTVIDPGRPNASSVAAGMIAPAFEAGLENATPEGAALYRDAAGRWPGFARDTEIDLVRDGADWIGPAEPLAARMAALGFAPEPRPYGFHMADEALVEPGPALARLGALVAVRGRRLETEARALRVTEAGVEVETSAGLVAGDRVLVATGWSAGPLEAPELSPLFSRIHPIKGQLLLMGGAGDAVGRVARAPGVYLAPRGDTVVIGATMEEGAADTATNPAVLERLRRDAVAAAPALAEARPLRGEAGVRGATEDGLPLVGAVGPRTFVALAPRRNGWLLAPLVADMLLAWLEGGDPGAWAETLRPDRLPQSH